MPSSRLVARALFAALLLTMLTVGVAWAQETTTEPPAATDDPATTPEATPETTDAPTADPAFTTYTVVFNDTLAKIALRFSTSTAEIAADNGIVNPNQIFVGQQLRIRTGQGTPATAVPTIAPPPTATLVPGSTGSYTVATGDTLFRIAVRFNTTVAELVRLNNLASANVIYVGQQLVVPGGTTAPAPTQAGTDATAVPAAASAEFDYGIEAYISPENATTTAASISDLGMHWVKVDVAWRDYEATEGQRDFTALDSIVSALEAQNLDILFTVSTSPDWARTSTDESGPPDDFADYAAFVGALAAQYAGRVDAYEIWTEPNLRREWNSSLHSISATSYLDLLRPAYAAIKAADANAVVVSAGLAPTGFNDGVNAINDRIYLASLYANGLSSVSDAVGAHPGGWANPPDSRCCTASSGVSTHFEDKSFYFLDTLTDYRDIIVQNGDAATAIWVTKFGWGTNEDMDAPPSIYIFITYTGLGEQAIYTPRAYELAQSLGYVGPMFLNNLNGCQVTPVSNELCYYSLIGPNGAPRPVYSAIQAIDTEATPTPFPTFAPTQTAPADATPDITAEAPASTEQSTAEVTEAPGSASPEATLDVNAPAATAEATVNG